MFLTKAVELARPGVVVSGGQSYLCGQLLLKILDRAGEVSSAHTELDWDVASAAFVIDREGAVSKVDLGHRAERHLIAIGSGDKDFADRIRGVAEFRRIPNRKVEAPVPIDDLRDRCATNRSLNDVVHILRLQTEAGGLCSVDGDEETRLTGNVEDPYVGNPWNLDP